MSIFGSILTRIFSDHGAVTEAIAKAAPQAAAAPAPAEPAPAPPGPALGPETTGGVPVAVDVGKLLAERAAHHAEKLNWRESIVDLLKVLDLDSSLNARRSLASELHYSGASADTAAMNIWLHREVMRKLAENGGKVPAELLG